VAKPPMWIMTLKASKFNSQKDIVESIRPHQIGQAGERWLSDESLPEARSVLSGQIHPSRFRFKIDWDSVWEDGDTEMEKRFKIRMLGANEDS